MPSNRSEDRGSTERKSILSAAGVLAIALIAGCSTSVARFDASPHRICHGGTTLLSWKVKGSAVPPPRLQQLVEAEPAPPLPPST